MQPDLTQPLLPSDFYYRARAFPLPDTDTTPNWGSLKPGRDFVGVSSETSTKQRLTEIFGSAITQASDYYGTVIANKKAKIESETEFLKAKRLAIQRANSPHDANSAALFLSDSKNQKYLLIGALVLVGFLLYRR
jgi:hypothetical protein